jgi:hypothetical protein
VLFSSQLTNQNNEGYEMMIEEEEDQYEPDEDSEDRIIEKDEPENED